MERLCLLAIDPGKSGGIAWKLVSGSKVKVTVIKMPDSELGIFDAIAEIERKALQLAAGNIHGIIERVNFRPKQRGGWEFSGNYHGCRMAMIALGIQFVNPTPGQWQKDFGLVQKLPKKKEEMTKQEINEHYKMKKQRSKELAQELYPELRVTHYASEALLLLSYHEKNFRTVKYGMRRRP